MKKIKLIMAALLVLMLPLVFVGTTYAGSFRSGTNVTVAKGETVDHTMFVAGQNLEINGTVKGDVFCAGQTVTITGQVEGDVICAGMNVNVSGTVMGDVRLAGETVILSGNVEKNASLAGSIVTVATNADVRGDLQVAGSNSTINGMIGRDADLAGETVILNAKVGRDIQASTENLRLDPGTAIAGSLTYYSKNQLSQDSAASVRGSVTQKDPVYNPEHKKTDPFPGFIFSLLATLAFAFVLLAVFPRKLRTLTDLALTRPGRTMLIGLAACVGVPILIIASFLSFIGFMVGIVLTLGWIIVMMSSMVLASYYAGRLVLAKFTVSPFVAMLTGVAVLSLLLALPGVNILVGIAVMLLGSGMLIRELLKRSPKPRYDALTHPSTKRS